MSRTEPGDGQTVRVELGARSYDIVIGEGLLAHSAHWIAPLVKRPKLFLVSDETVAGLWLETFRQGLRPAGIEAHLFQLPPGETSKSWVNLEEILNWLFEAGANRDDLLVALGGGVVGDITGLAAALMKRGMGFLQVPTTLLAQVDSSVGGKTAVNSRFGKNLIGAFQQPRLVIADVLTLATLPEREWRAGMAEVVKYGLIDDPDFFDALEADPPHRGDMAGIVSAVARSCQAKARIVAQDEREGGVRALLNLGHTFGHALEKANDYKPSLLHGEAVACGMAMAMRYSVGHGLCRSEDAARTETLLNRLGLVTRVTALDGGPYDAEALLAHMGQDKKARAGRLPLILARGIGRSLIRPDNDTGDLLEFLKSETEAPEAALP
jgi:3-dehydroquinate synthase